MAEIHLLLGTNLGNRKENLSVCIAHLESRIGAVIQISSIYETAPWGFSDQPSFFNQAIKMITPLSAQEILVISKSIEELMGRIDAGRWRERLIDVDILYYGDDILNDKNLKIPHPQLHNRKFALAPLAEISPLFVHPILHKNSLKLLEECRDPLQVSKIT